jgi:hypothetical protein
MPEGLWDAAQASTEWDPRGVLLITFGETDYVIAANNDETNAEQWCTDAGCTAVKSDANTEPFGTVFWGVVP